MEWLLIATGLLLVAACGAFVAAEFAMITVDRPTLERAADGPEPCDGGGSTVRIVAGQCGMRWGRLVSGCR